MSPGKSTQPTIVNNSNKDENPPNDAAGPNRPRNFYVTDATQPFSYSFKGRFHLQHTLTIHQTPNDLSWPGGALWDLGVLLSNLLLAIVDIKAATTTTSCNVNEKGNAQGANNLKKVKPCSKFKSKNHVLSLPLRPSKDTSTTGTTTTEDWEEIRSIFMSEKSIVMELGCGVGLTGLVAAAALRPHAVILTDLKVVIDTVTQQNVEENTQLQKPHRVSGKTICQAVPLCWGDEEDEHHVATLIKGFQTSLSSLSAKSKRKTKKSSNSVKNNDNGNSIAWGKPDIVLIGDVAYQHCPGNPSHFEALHSTLLRFLHDDTIVVFGTRIRMPASNDLLQLFLQDMEELVVPPVSADEIDPSFAKIKHNMSIHFLRRKRSTPPTEITDSAEC